MVLTNNMSGHPSFVGPSRIRTLVVPIGKWHRQDFLEAVQSLREYREIRLVDITPIDSFLFTPQGFPNGRLFLDYVLSAPNDAADLFLYDFEPFRKIFIVIGLVNDDSNAESNFNVLKERYPTVISHNLIYTSPGIGEIPSSLQERIFQCKDLSTSNLETIVCDICKNFLKALDRYYSSYKHVTLRSPGAIGGNSVLKTTLDYLSSTVTATSPNLSASSKRASTFDINTNTIKRSASLKIARSLTTSDSIAQQRSQGRQLKILGNLQLLAGRYVDALNSFTEAMALLHVVRDCLWLGSALDGMAMCIILLAYLQLSFNIPQVLEDICPPLKNTNSNSNNTNSELSNSSDNFVRPRESISIASLQSPRNSTHSIARRPPIDLQSVDLIQLVHTISEKVLYYYEASLSHNTEYAPQVVYCEFLLKMLTFMISCYKSSDLTPESLKSIVFSSPMDGPEIKNLNPTVFSKLDIYCFANRIFELQLKDMSVDSQLSLYYTLAEVYRVLGYSRKRVFVLRLLLVTLASDRLNVRYYTEHKTLLLTIMRLYGIYGDGASKTPESIIEGSWPTLQKKAVQLCLDFSERSADHESMAQFTELLLSSYSHLMSHTEQRTLFQEYVKPLLASKRMQKYWDPFMLRSAKMNRLEFDGLEEHLLPAQLSFDTAFNASMKGKNQSTEEVFNPFKTQQTTSGSKENALKQKTNCFLVDDRAELVYTFQNPFDFDVSITGISLPQKVAEYVDLKHYGNLSDNPIIIKPSSVQELNLPIVFKKATNNKVLVFDSLFVSVFGLPIQEFKILLDRGRGVSEHKVDLEVSYSQIHFKVLPFQPELQVVSSTAETGIRWMMLDGTKQTFKLLLWNKSLASAIDYIKISHHTNFEKALKSDYWKKLAPDDLFSLESKLQYLKNSCIKVLNKPSIIKPNETYELQIELDMSLAPIQLSTIDLKVEYGAMLPGSKSVYIKDLHIPVHLTLKRCLEVVAIEVLPLQDTFVPGNESDVDWICYLSSEFKKATVWRASSYALLLFDVRNSWSDTVDLKVEYEGFKSNDYYIEPDHTIRVVVPMAKIDCEVHKFGLEPIPKVFKGRQFIQTNIDEGSLISIRESFWCKEYILTRLKGRWKYKNGELLKGVLNFRQFFDAFESSYVQLLYPSKIPCKLLLSLDKAQLLIGQRFELTVDVRPLKPDNQSLLLDFIAYDKQTCKIITKNDKRLLYNGVLSRTVSLSSRSELKLQVIAMERGHYEICVQYFVPGPIIEMNSNKIAFTVN